MRVIFKIIFIILMQLIEDYYQKKNSKKRLKKCLKDAEKERVKLQNSLIIKIKQLLSPHLLSCECKNNLFINDCISLIFCKNSTALSFKISCSCSFYPYFIGQSNYVNKNSSKWCKYLNFN